MEKQSKYQFDLQNNKNVKQYNKNYQHYYWKYMRYQWRSWLLSCCLAFFFGPLTLLWTWIILSICYNIDWSRARRETIEQERHIEMLRAHGVDVETPEEKQHKEKLIKQMKELRDLNEFIKQSPEHTQGEA